jgi:hypothetical protein
LHHDADDRKRLEKCNKELMFEKKMTSDLHAFRMVLIQAGNDVMVVCAAESRLEKSKQNNRKDNTEIETVIDKGVDDGGGKDRV